MGGFYYNDIFSTKGIEYLLIISFFITFIPFYRYLREVESPLFSLSRVRMPGGVMFDRTHTWAFLRSAGNVQVGIDDFLAALTGPVTLQLTKRNGEQIARGDHLATILGDGKSLRVYSPVSGTLKSINKSALKRFSARTRNDFTENWLFDLQPMRWDAEKPLLIMGEKAQQWIQQETARLRDVLAFAQRKYDPTLAPVILQEGGELADHMLASMAPEIWEEIQTEFIDAAKT